MSKSTKLVTKIEKIIGQPVKMRDDEYLYQETFDELDKLGIVDTKKMMQMIATILEHLSNEQD